MAVSALHTLYAVNLEHATLDVLIDQVANQNLNSGLQQIVRAGDGQVDPTYVAVGQQAPVLTFGTSQLTTLGDVGIDGLPIGATQTYTAVSAWFQKMSEGGTRLGAGSHEKLTINEGIVVPRTLQATNGDVAVLTYDVITTYDGTNDPVVITGSASLDGSPATAELFTVGPVSINGTTLNGVQTINIDFGIEVITRGGDGQVWPTYAAIISRRPTITIEALDVSILNTLDIHGAPQSATNSLVYFRKLDEGGTRVADATQEHIKLAIDEGLIYTDAIQGNDGDVLGATVMIQPTYDGTNAIIAIDTGSAIA